MKRLDKMVIQELIGPWGFGLGMFAALVMASTYLFRVTDFFVQGISIWTVLELVALLLPGILVKTFAMAMLLAGLLGFGRLSSDSEVIALKASGVSILRMMWPVAIMSIIVAIIAFGVNELIVPLATSRSLKIQSDIARTLDVKVTQWSSTPITDKKTGNLQMLVTARDFNISAGTLRGVTAVSYDDKGDPKSVLYAKEMRWNGTQPSLGKGWRLVGGAEIISVKGSDKLILTGDAWPQDFGEFDTSPADIGIAHTTDQMDAFTINQMREYIAAQRLNRSVTPSQIANLEFGYWNKFAFPLAALIYGLLGAPLGVRNVRTGTASGFALAIGIIFAYVQLGAFINVYAQGGVIPPYVASFAPVVIGLLCSGVIMWRRNL